MDVCYVDCANGYGPAGRAPAVDVMSGKSVARNARAVQACVSWKRKLLTNAVVSSHILQTCWGQWRESEIALLRVSAGKPGTLFRRSCTC